MFFKRGQQEAVAKSDDMSSAAPTPRPLAASELRRQVDPATLGFKSTAELEPILGLDRPGARLKAIQFGANIKNHDFNVFVLGPAASGKTTALRQYLERRAAETRQRRRTGSTSTTSKLPTSRAPSSCSRDAPARWPKA